MGARDFLEQVRHEQKELNQLQDLIRQAELSLLPSGIRYDLDKVQTSPDDPMFRMLAKVADYQTEMRKRLELLTLKRQQAFAMIGELEDSRHRQVMQLYFLDPDRLKMREVAERMGYSERKTYELYLEALEILEKCAVKCSEMQ